MHAQRSITVLSLALSLIILIVIHVQAAPVRPVIMDCSNEGRKWGSPNRPSRLQRVLRPRQSVLW